MTALCKSNIEFSIVMLRWGCNCIESRLCRTPADAVINCQRKGGPCVHSGCDEPALPRTVVCEARLSCGSGHLAVRAPRFPAWRRQWRRPRGRSLEDESQGRVTLHVDSTGELHSRLFARRQGVLRGRDSYSKNHSHSRILVGPNGSHASRVPASDGVQSQHL